jgi:thioredoxin-dependent peroxiredoxin
MAEPKIGNKAPAFTAPDANGDKVKLSDFKGKKVVLYFYPKDNTSGCTKEACEFRDSHTAFGDANTVILGVSPDSAKSHTNFVAKYELPFTLLSDPDHKVAEKYGVWKEKKNYGRTYMGIERSTFLIDEKGKLVGQFRKVKVAGHVDVVLDLVK